VVFFNQVQLHHPFCLDPATRKSLVALFKEEGLPRNVYYGDGTRIEDETMKKLGDLYKACMDEPAIEKSAVGELAALLRPIDQIKSPDDLAREIARQHQGIGKPLFDFSASPDFKNANQIIGSLDQSGLGLPDRDYYLKTDEKSEALRKEYLGHVERMLVLAGVPKDKAAGAGLAVAGRSS
jgi:predicted metalloendopeptidase